MGLMQRRKGKEWEREIARRFREIMPDENIKRGWQARDGSDAPDVDVPSFWIEAKHQIKCNAVAALEQANGAALPGRYPIAICKDNRRDPFVVIGFDDFLEIVGQWWKLLNQ